MAVDAQDIMAELLPGGLPDLGDDGYWAERDAKVRAANKRDATREEAERQAANRRAMADMGAPRRLLEMVPRRTPAVDDLHAALTRHPDGVLVLCGGVGVGKSSAALLWLQKQLGPLWWSSAADLARASRYDKAPAWRDARAGVLDDLGTEYLDRHGAYLSDLDAIVNHYHGQMRPLVITTNLPAAAFKERYGERIASRLRECGEWVTVAGDDMRGQR